MSLDQQSRARIDEMVRSHRVVLFMKGTPAQPQCGFSATTIGILDALVPEYATFNVLEDQRLREGIKAYSNWPTIPQLYVDGEFIGGCDITKQMFNTGELHEALGLGQPDRTPPEIEISDGAADTIRAALESNPGVSVHLGIDARWQHNFTLGPAEGHEVRSESNGIVLLMDLASAAKARGLKLDVEETLQGKAFRVENPNAPPSVQQMSVQELSSRRNSGATTHLIDVRPADERAKALIEGATALDDGGMDILASLSKDAAIVFYCHTGQRSQAAAEHFRLQGYSNVYNLTGGVDAWSQEVDPGVPRY